jgi:hypothetical protein
MTWEVRESPTGVRRVLGLCVSKECGAIATPQIADNPAGSLEAFLLGEMPAKPSVPPWRRLFLKSSRAGLHWTPHHRCCWECGGELVMAARIPIIQGGERDPSHATLCLACGATTLRTLGTGEWTTVLLTEASWILPSIEVRAFQRAISVRYNEVIGPPPPHWHFS